MTNLLSIMTQKLCQIFCRKRKFNEQETITDNYIDNSVEDIEDHPTLKKIKKDNSNFFSPK